MVIRTGFEDQYDPSVPHYFEDESYPPSSENNRRSIAEGFNELFVVNCAVHEERVTALPKGVSPPLHPWRLAAARPSRPKTDLAYANFSLGHPDHPEYTARRKRVYETIRPMDWITFENVGNQFGDWQLTWLEFYRRVGQHRFTISPQGNGVDCHRTWEALYMKSVPIVERSPEMSHFERLPILFTDDYSELTPEYLDEQYARILDTEYDFELLKLSHWKRKIAAAIDRSTAAS